MADLVKDLIRRVACGGEIFNTFVGVTCLRFSLSLVNDLLWYAGIPRKALLVLALTFVLWVSWLFRPWAEAEEIQE